MGIHRGHEVERRRHFELGFCCQPAWRQLERLDACGALVQPRDDGRVGYLLAVLNIALDWAVLDAEREGGVRIRACALGGESRLRDLRGAGGER